MKIDINKIDKFYDTDNYKKDKYSLDFLKTEIKLFKNKLNNKKKEQFYSKLETLLSAGLDIKSSFDIIIQEQKKQEDKDVFILLNKKIITGNNLSEAMKSINMFSPYEYYSIKIGEESGNLNNILKDLAVFFSEKIKQKRQIINSLSYPVLVLFTALGTLYFLLNFMVPMFQDIFNQFGNELPDITKFVIKISDNLNKYFLYLTTFVLLTIFLFYYYKEKKWMKKLTSKILLNLPFMGNIIKTVYLERFFHSLALLAGAGVNMNKAMELIEKMLTFYPFQTAIKKMQKDIINGMLLSESMKQFSLFDQKTRILIKLAEEVNKIEEISYKIKKQYAEELNHKVSIISNMLEPIMILIVGVLVAVILISMYLPIFKMSSSGMI